VSTTYLPLARYGGFAPERMATFKLVALTQEQVGDILYEQTRNFEPLLLIDRLAMQMYRDRDGNLLLGARDEALHPHDRWQYYCPAGDTAWYMIGQHGTVAESCQGLVRELRLDERSMAEFETRLHESVGPSYYWRLAQAPHQLADRLVPLLANAVLSPHAMHEMIFHYGSWLLKNPESQGLPGPLVARMHGLGELVDWMEQHR
jgi:hypothetical protein